MAKKQPKISKIFDYFEKEGIGRGDIAQPAKGADDSQGESPHDDGAIHHSDNEQPTVQGRKGLVAEGVWTDVSRSSGLVTAIGVIPDEKDPRLLRSEENGELVVWHLGRLDYRCPRKNIKPEEVVFNWAGAPWCPDCFKRATQEARLKSVFAQNSERMKSLGNPTRTIDSPINGAEESRGIDETEILWSETPR